MGTRSGKGGDILVICNCGFGLGHWFGGSKVRNQIFVNF